MAQHIEEIVLKLRDQFSKPMKVAEKNTKKVRKQTSKLDTQVKKLQRTAAAAFGAFVVVQAIKNIANLGIEMEQTRVAFSTFLGDAEKANEVIKDLNDFSNVTPFRNDEVIAAGKSLLAFGTPVEKLKEQLKSIGDISAGTGKNFNELTTIYGKAQIAGTLYAEDINQLVEAGIPIISEFAKQLGVNESQIKKMASQGKIGFGELQTAFKNLTSDGGTFFNLMEKQSKTVGGQLSTLKGKLGDVGVTMGEALLPVMGDIIKQVSVLTEWISKNKDAIAFWFPIVLKAVAAIAAVVIAIKIWIGVQAMLNAVMIANPVGLIIVGIAALIAILTIWRKKIIKLMEDNKALGVVVALLFAPIVALILLVEGISRAIDKSGLTFENFADHAGAAFEVIAQKATALIEVLKGVAKLLLNPFSSEGLGQFKRGIKDLTESPSELHRTAFKERQDARAEKAMVDAAFAADDKSNREAGIAANLAKTTGLGNLITDGAKSGVSAGLSGVSSSAPRNVTISIEKIVESLNINTTTLKEGTAEIREEITKALLTAINDSQIIAA